MKNHLHRLLTATCLGCLSLAGAPLAQAGGLGLDSSLNLLSFGNFYVPSGSDVQGQVAVGGNAYINGYSINTATGAGSLYGGTGLTVGGNLDFINGGIWGNTVVGGNLSTTGGSSFFGSVQVAGSLNANNEWLSAPAISYGGSLSGVTQWSVASTPVQVAAGSIQPGINFAAEQQRLTGLSQSFDSLSNIGSGVSSWGTLVFDAKGADLAVFDLSGADVSSGNIRLDNVGANTSVIFNVHGQSVNFGVMGYANFAPGHVLFNLPDATQMTFVSAVDASFLAPMASFTPSAGGGFINGQVVVANWSGNVQVNSSTFITPVPEPETYALMLAGLALMGSVVRRRSLATNA